MRNPPFTTHPLSPFDAMRLGFETSRMVMDAQMVMSMRMMGMAGLWDVAPTETTKMVTEKQVAFFNAAVDTSMAVASGKAGTDIARAAVDPFAQKTKQNASRLAKRGPSHLR